MAQGYFEKKDLLCIGKDGEPKAPLHHKVALKAGARRANNVMMVVVSQAKKLAETAEDYADSQINAYHQSQSTTPFVEFKQKGDKGYKKAHYSQATVGIYFSPNKELVQKKYGKAGGKLIAVHLDMKNPLDLGQYDAMYFDGRKVNYGEVVVENFKREQRGEKPVPEPEIILIGISKKAKKWLLQHGYDGVQGMRGEGWSAPEYVVFDTSQIKTREQLIEDFNRGNYG